MTEDTPITTAPPPSAAARIAWGGLIVITLAVCYFSNLGAIGLVGPDEPRYAWIAREMAETGDWVTPRLYGKPWFEKPVLYYWMAGASFKLFGVNEITARLPSAFCALFATLALAWLAWRTYGAQTGRWLLLLLPTSVGMIGFSHAAATDMPFSGMLSIAMVCAAVVLGLTRSDRTPILPRTPWLGLILFGFFLGLAVLAKGPAAIILSGGAVLFWAIFTKRWRDAFRLLHPVAIVSFCATALPWYILCARRNPDFFRVFIIEHNFKRYLTPEFQHIQPFWYYAPIVLVAFLPWTPAVLGFSIDGAKTLLSRHTLHSVSRLLLCWSLFCLLFFSMSQSKLPGYVLPAFPAIALLLANALATTRTSSAAKWFTLIFGILFLICLVPVRFALHQISPVRPLIFWAYAAVLASFALANLCLFASESLRSRSDATAAILRATAVLLMLLPVFFAGQFVGQFFLSDPSGRTLAHSLQEHSIPIEKLALISGSRGFKYSLNFYLHREVPDWTGAENGEAYVLAYTKGCSRPEFEGFSCQPVAFNDERNDWRILRLTPKVSARPRP